MKRANPKKLQLNLETVRTLQQPRPLDDQQLGQVVGGLKSGSGVGVICTNTHML